MLHDLTEDGEPRGRATRAAMVFLLATQDWPKTALIRWRFRTVMAIAIQGAVGKAAERKSRGWRQVPQRVSERIMQRCHWSFKVLFGISELCHGVFHHWINLSQVQETNLSLLKSCHKILNHPYIFYVCFSKSVLNQTNQFQRKHAHNTFIGLSISSGWAGSSLKDDGDVWGVEESDLGQLLLEGMPQYLQRQCFKLGPNNWYGQYLMFANPLGLPGHTSNLSCQATG